MLLPGTSGYHSFEYICTCEISIYVYFYMGKYQFDVTVSSENGSHQGIPFDD